MPMSTLLKLKAEMDSLFWKRDVVRSAAVTYMRVQSILMIYGIAFIVTATMGLMLPGGRDDTAVYVVHERGQG